MRLLKKRPKSFDVQVHDMTLTITASPDLQEEARAAALSFWEQLESYTLQHPAFRTSKRAIEAPADAPEIIREMTSAAARAGVGPMFTFQGALTDHVGRLLSGYTNDVSVGCGGDLFIVAKKRQKLGVRRSQGEPISIVVPARPKGVGVSTSLGRARGSDGPDGLAVLAESCMLAGAAAAGVQAIVAKPDGLALAVRYLRKIRGVQGGVVLQGERVGVAGGVEITPP